MRARKTLAVLAVGTLLTSGCATSGLASLPLPAPGVGSGGYHLKAIFANALNLPANAKVKLAGADVGQVDSMKAKNYTAVTELRIMDGVDLPQGTTAELRSATPLGDVFVSLRPPTHTSPGAPLLRDGDTIGLNSTTAAATVESVLSSASILVNGGAVKNFTNIINGFGKATGDQGQAFGDLIHKSNQLLGTLNSRSGQISESLTQTSQLADQLDAKNQTITDVLKAADPATQTLADNTSQIANIVMQVGDVARQLSRFPSIAGTDKSGRSVIKDANTVAKAWNDVAIDPNTSLAALNRQIPTIIKSTPSNEISVRVSVDQLVLGSLADAGSWADIGSHGPKRYNWAQLVGTMKYTLWRLQEKVVGKGPDADAMPVRPSPTEPGVIEPVPGAKPTPGGVLDPQGPPPGPAPAPAPEPVPAPAPADGGGQ